MLLTAETITVTYKSRAKRVQAVLAATVQLAAGELVVVSGPSGSGKSSLLLTLGGLLRPDTGIVRFRETDVYQLAATARAAFRNRHIGFVFQQFHLIPYLTVLENIMAPTLAGNAVEKSADPRELIARFQLNHRAEHYPSQLSTGERQRVALARALFHNPDVILADEPTGNLDDVNGRIVIDHLQSIAADGRGVLVVTHDARLRPAATRSLTLIQGNLTQEKSE